MAYYNRAGKRLIENQPKKYLNSGSCSKVYVTDDKIFKQYRSDIPFSCKITPKVFDLLKSIKNPHLMELDEIYGSFNIIQLCKYKSHRLPFLVDVYTARYYVDDQVNVLYNDKDYLLDNFNELEKLFAMFTDLSLCVEDVKRENAILNKERIIVIDPDRFHLENSTHYPVALENKRKLLTLFRHLCISSLEDMTKYSDLIKWLNTIQVTDKTELTQEIDQQLQYVKKPIDIIRSK